MSTNWMRRRHGATLIYTSIAAVVLFGFVSLGVDLGRVQLVKTELQTCADAAARYAASGILDGTALSKAIAVASQNAADGSAVTLTGADVETGNWSASLNPKFSTSRTPTNAVRVTARRTAARGNAVPLIFGRAVGASNCDVSAVSVAFSDRSIISGWIGLDGITVKNNLLSASYDSSVDTSPTQSTYSNSGMIGSNGAITAKNNEVVGQVVLGPSGSHNLTLPTPPIVLTQDIATPSTDFTPAPAVNPGGVAQNLSVNGTTLLAGGTYHFTSVALSNNSKLTFAGAATVYIDGNVSFSQKGEIAAYNDIPSNLVIYQRGESTTFGGSNANQVDFTGVITAPQTALTTKNSATLRGHGIFKSIESKNNAEYYYDEALSSIMPGVINPNAGPVTVVK